MNLVRSAFLAILAQAFSQCTALAADVMPVWQNDTVANSLTFNDTFGHQVVLGSYNPGTGAWMPSGSQTIIVGTSVITGTCPSGQVLINAAGVVGCSAAGSGTVTSVALTVPSFLTVAGSPITTSGTLAVTATSEPQNEVLASPDGASGAMTPRTLVAGDISGIPGNLASGSSPITGTCSSGQVLFDNAGVMGCTAGGGSGTVTSVALTTPTFLTVTGSPITGAGTLAVTATSEPQNMFLASPNGSSGAMVPRSVTGNDLTSALASPPSIGNTTANTGAFTTLSASGAVSGAGITSRFASPGPIGNTAASTGAFTTLSASSTVSGTGFSTYLASPPAIGGTAAAAGSFTTLSASGAVTGVGITALFASPPAIGGTAPGTGAFTGLSSTLASSIAGAPFNPSITPPAPGFTPPAEPGILLVGGVSFYIAGAPTSAAQDIPAGTLYVSKNTNYTGVPAMGTLPAIYGFNDISAGAQGPQAGVVASAFNGNTLTSQPTGTSGGIGIQGVGTCGVTACTATWGGDIAVYDTTSQTNPTHPLIGLEVDNYAHGTDTSLNRVGIQIAASTPDNLGTLNTVGHGILFTGLGTAHTGQFTNLIDGSNSVAVNGIVLSAMTLSGVAFNSPGFLIDNLGNVVASSLALPVTTPVVWGTNTGTSGGQVTIVSGTTGMFFDDLGGGPWIFRTTGVVEEFRISATGVLSSAGTPGVVCSGTPTISFATKGGIVTHC